MNKNSIKLIMPVWFKKKHNIIIKHLFSIIIAVSFLLSTCNFSLGLTDEMGRTVPIRGIPKRIIALTPSITEILFALGEGDRLVGVSQNSEFPEAAKQLPKIGPYHRPNLEKIISLQPDLVIASVDGTPKALADELDRLRIPTYAINPKSVKQVVNSVINIRTIFNSPRADQVVRKMEKAINCASENLSKVRHRPKVLYQLDFNPLIIAGKGTFSDSVLELAGGLNIANGLNGKYPRYSIEQVILSQPEVIMVSTMQTPEHYSEICDHWSQWADIPAVKHGRVYAVQSDLVDRPSPRCIQGLIAVLKFLHPRVAEKARRCMQ